MAKLFILIKKKGNKRIMGAIPVKSRVAVSKLKDFLPSKIRKGFDYKVITEAQLNRAVNSLKPKRVVKVKRKTVRGKRPVKKRTRQKPKRRR